MARTTQQEETLTAGTLFGAEADLVFPRRFDVHGKVHGNPVRRLATVEQVQHCRIGPFSTRNRSGFIATDQTGRSTYLFAKATSSLLGEQVLLAGGDTIKSVQRALSERTGRWLSPKPIDPNSEAIATSEERCQRVVESWREKFEFRQEHQNPQGEIVPGLRLPQVGALHAGLAHWSVSHSPGTIVMPTGTGKTETMLALLVCVRLNRLLVVVPNNALRDQVSEKFLTLGVLEHCGCITHSTELPVVASLLHRPQSRQEVDDIFLRANVIVSTMQVVGQCAPELQQRMAELCSHLFIDEAHHIAARTWKAFKQQFEAKPVLQFTATPFRTDGQRVDGKFIYSYPLAKAQNEGYFRRINFIPIAEFDEEEADRHIARKAVERLNEDLEAGHDHVLMARVDTIDRADTVLKLYQQEATALNPVAIHSGTTKAERRDLLAILRSRQSRILVCVDMFGEGFDFPELKVAALAPR